MKKLIVKIDGELYSFSKNKKDGWWETKGYAISPNKEVCVTDPWLADHICSAPTHKFKIIKECV